MGEGVKVWHLTATDRCELFEVPDRAVLAKRPGGVLGYLSARFFKRAILDVRTVNWLGETRHMAVDDSGRARLLPRNRIASEAYVLANQACEGRVVVGDAVIVEHLEAHPLHPLVPIELEQDAFLRGCVCDYCVHIESHMGRKREQARGVTCPKCRRRSWHPKDIEQHYCAACAEFWGRPA